MDFLNLLPSFHELEPNNLKGIQPGFVVSQLWIKDGSSLINSTAVSGHKFLENGHLASISKDGVDIWAPGKPLFIVFNEELDGLTTARKNYATDLDEEYPRLVQLIPGDEWTTDIDYDSDAAYASIKSVLDTIIVKLDDVKSPDGSSDAWFADKTFPDGTTAHHYMYLGGAEATKAA